MMVIDLIELISFDKFNYSNRFIQYNQQQI